MNVTESRFKNRQLHIEDYLQMVSAEQKEYAEVFDYGKITEKSGIITDYWTNNLLDLILRKDNLNKAYKRVKIRQLTDRNNGMSNAIREEKYQQYVRGWVQYFRLADMKSLLKTTDEWARRRIRAVYWKQWKKIKTKYRMLKALGMEHWRAKELACSRKGYWRMAKVLNQIFSNKIIARLGYTSFLDYYLIVCEN